MNKRVVLLLLLSMLCFSLLLTPVQLASESFLTPNAGGYITELRRIGNLAPDPNENYKLVDEIVADDNTSYVYSRTTSGTGYQKDSYEVTDNYSAGAIHNFTVYFRTYTTNVGLDGRPFIRIDGTNYYGSYVTPAVINAWQNFSYYWTLNPATGTNWTWLDLQDIEVGFDAEYGVGVYYRLTHIYAVVNFTSVSIESFLIITFFLAILLHFIFIYHSRF